MQLKQLGEEEMNSITLETLKKDPLLFKNLQQLTVRPRYMWSLGRYDGILSGICMYNNKPHYFDTFVDFHMDGNIPGYHNRYYAVVELTDEEFMLAEFNHILFRDTVGWHSDFDENGKAYERYPEFTDLSKMSSEELAEKFRSYYDGIAKTIKHTTNYSKNNVVAFWDADTVWNSEKCFKPNNPFTPFLKAKILELHDLQKKNKIERRTDSNQYNSICYHEGQNIRAHLIAYAILRGKSYAAMEQKNSKVFDTKDWDSTCLLNKVHELCTKYCFKSDEIKYSKEVIKNILLRKMDKVG